MSEARNASGLETATPVEHTRLPWKVETFGRYIRLTEATHEDDNNDVLLVGDCENEQVRANLEFVARACNAHDELVAALKSIEAGCSFPNDDVQRACRDRARAALAKVGA